MTALALVLGSLAGLVLAPVLVLALPVLPVLALVHGWAESRWGLYTVGDGGASIGPLQYNDSTRAALGISEDRALSAWWSGWYLPRLVLVGLRVSPGQTLAALLVPGLGLAQARALWRGYYGVPWSEALALAREELLPWWAWVAHGAAALAWWVLAVAVAWRAWAWYRGRGGGR